jgi:mannose/fructose/N-acetylgalactosamine-specific phosphotransferase system component IIC
MNPIVVASLVGGVLAVDYRSSLGLMASQPLCGGLITGLLLGAPAEGLLAGGLLQMMFLGHVPVRGEQIPDLPMAGVAAATLYVLVNRAVGADPSLRGIVLFWSILVAILVASIGQLFYRWWERRAAFLAAAAVRSAQTGSILRVSAMHLSVLLLHFSSAFCILFVVVAAGRPLLVRGTTILAGVSGETLSTLAVLVPFAGVGGLLRLHFIRTRIFWFGAGFLVSYLFLLVRG